MARKKILAITCELGRPAQATAAWDGENLFILEVTEADGDAYAWLAKAREDIEQKCAAGWVAMVGDRTISFPPPATCWNMNAISPEGKTSLHSAMEMYFALQSRGAILFEPHLKRYEIRLGDENGMAYMETDDRGRGVYRVNWKEFRSPHLVVLMCVAGATLEEPLSDRWMTEFMGNLPEPKKAPIWPVFRVMRELWDRQNREFEARVAAVEAQKHV